MTDTQPSEQQAHLLNVISPFFFSLFILPALLSPAASCDINNLVSALRTDEHLADCVLLGFCLSHFSFFCCRGVIVVLTLWNDCDFCRLVEKYVFFFRFSFFSQPPGEPPLDVLQPLAAVNWIAAALICCKIICMNFWASRLFFFFLFLYKLHFRTVFHIPSRPAFKTRSSAPPLVPAQLNKGHDKINDSQRKHLTVFCSAQRAGNASSSVWYWLVWTRLLSIWMRLASELHGEGCRY